MEIRYNDEMRQDLLEILAGSLFAMKYVHLYVCTGLHVCMSVHIYVYVHECMCI